MTKNKQQSIVLASKRSGKKGTIIPCRMRLARNADKLTESINLTWAEYQDYSAHQLSDPHLMLWLGTESQSPLSPAFS